MTLRHGFSVVVLAMCCVLATAAARQVVAQTKDNIPVDPNAVDPGTMVRCPDCRELVRFDATKCKHCGAALTPLATDELLALAFYLTTRK